MAPPHPSLSLIIRRSSPDTAIPNPGTLIPAAAATTASTLSSILTEERLRDHDRRTTNATASPYYRGFSRLGLSPSRESLASSFRSSSSSSSVLVTLQEWNPFCFSANGKKKEVGNGGELPKMLEGQLAYPQLVSWDPGQSVPRGVTDSRKPLRESDLMPAAPVAPVNVNVPMRPLEVAGEEVRKEREYVWAYKHRPKFLKEFVCNRGRVEELEEMVSS